ncbi:MAG TPA: DNA methyltransferase [Candidatus Bathyarchaeia archaeon]|nr:DNA methyltransferase [Candidatus Bathyarchaeia archaeon]
MIIKHSNELSVLEQFIEKYLSIENRILSNYSNVPEIQLREFYYFLVKKALIDKFQLNFLFDKEVFLPLNAFKGYFNDKLKHKILPLISEELISPFNFSLLEDSESHQFVTPYIFSLIFETSLHLETKQKSGSYYTSHLEVEFMCAEALYYHLSNTTKIDKIKLGQLIWNYDKLALLKLTENEIKTLISQINEIRIIDPACGSGAFIVGFIQLLFRLNRELLALAKKPFDKDKTFLLLIQKNLFGLDINNEALAIAKLRLYAYLLANKIKLEKNLSCNLFKSNALIEDFKIKFNKTDFLFDIVIGNPPYIRQEQFTISNDSQIINDDYKSFIIDRLEVFFDNKIIIPKNRKSDFYVFFFYRALSLLKENGLLCFITSNSWLDSKFGNNFRKILLENFKFNSIQTSIFSKSFSSAINTVIVILTKELNAHLSEDNYVRFEIFKKSINEIIKNNPNSFISQKISHAPTKEIDVLNIQQKILYANLANNKSYKNKWSSYYFRAPRKIVEILENNQEKLTNFDSIGIIRYPIKTGLNDFFIVNEETRLEYSIESEFLIPLLKSPKKISSYYISEDSLKYKIFICDKSKEILRNENKIGALKYIEWGENQLTQAKQQTKEGILWPNVPSVKTHLPYWYTLPKIPPADIFCVRFFDRRFFFCYSDSGIIEDQTFYGLLLNQSIKKDLILLLGLLNSTFNYIMLEIFGRTSLGKGALQYSINDFKVLPIIDPSMLPEKLRNKIIEKTNVMLKNKINSLFSELKLEDRLALDKLLFNWLGINDSEIKEIYEIAIELVNNRLKKSVQKI